MLSPTSKQTETALVGFCAVLLLLLVFTWAPWRREEEATLSWYLRPGDRSSFAEWEARLRLACQPAQQQADDEESDTSSSSEEGDERGDDADGRDAPRAAREEERAGRGAANPFLHPVLTSLMQCIPDAPARERRGAAPLV